MLSMPLETIKEKITAQKGLSADEIDKLIKKKLDSLSGLISQEGAAHIVANELGVKLVDISGSVTIKELVAGLRNVEFAGKIIRKYEVREFSTEKSTGKVGSCLVGDNSGLIRLVFWNEQIEKLDRAKEGDVVRVKGAFVRDNSGRLEVHINTMTSFILNPPDLDPSSFTSQAPKEEGEFTRKKISDLQDQDVNIELLGYVFEVFSPRFFEVCPQCNARMRPTDAGLACSTHGVVEPKYNFVLNLYFDDGSDTIRLVCWREQAKDLLGLTDEAILAFKDDLAAFSEVKQSLLGEMIKISGRAQMNSLFGHLEFIVSSVSREVKADEEIKEAQEEFVEASNKVASAEVPKEKTEPAASRVDATASKDVSGSETAIDFSDIEF
ncbi:MAG: hypothetical protein H6502_01980 [Candidatus Woesearchaeota archaeon]|nr:MAG: hypothetical protein H6502_01980 [Candidatus Woesearchaeota archaeon]